jgi:hypothetical protein
MSDLPPEGTAAHPYVENTYTQKIVGINFGGLAVHFYAGEGPPVDDPAPPLPVALSRRR